MGRRLPDPIEREPDETDEQFDTRLSQSKRQLQIFKRIYQNYFHWQSLREAGEIDDLITIEGVDYYIGDLLVGIDTLPRQQRRAFELICLRGFTESAATEEILPNSRWSTPVQQYSDDGLRKMVSAYYAKQAGTWNPAAAMRRRPRRKDEQVTATSTAPAEQRKWDWNSWSDDHASLAEYINTETGLNITPAQVKAVSFLRSRWWNSPNEVATRQRRVDEREAEKAKWAYETKEQREKRFAANRVLKSQAKALEQAQALMDKAKKLRAEAGLNPETGDPI